MRTDVRSTRRGRRPHGWGSLLAALALLLVLAPIVAHADDVTLSWTAPGDDGSVGTANSYELRVSTSQITSGNWGSAPSRAVGTPSPLVAGTRQSTVVTNLSPDTTYWFAIKAVDDAGNWSNISNIVRWDWILDTAPPGAPTGLSAAKQSNGTVRVTWAANSEPDLSGYNVYRALSASGPYSALNGALVSAPPYVDSGIPSGTAMVWYQVSAEDASGNVSARSSTFALDLTAVAAADAWSIATGYPNPSGTGTTVRIPLVAPASGGAAALEIVNDVGQRVRWLDLGSVSPGAMEVPWDGKNDGGREVAPGVYTVWLVTGGTRLSVRLVRVP
jgi:chitodextrinase